MGDMNMEERIAIKDSARSLKKYGSTSNYNCKRLQDRFLKHEVKQTDTLQGLALKYGVTMEDIRRANRLWANDSLFLREWLLIPSEGGVKVGSEDLRRAEGPTNGEREDSPSDFLVRIDCAIASTKSQLISANASSQFVSEEAEAPQWRRKGARLRRSSDGESTHQTEVVIMTHGRKVRDSLHRLEKENDEIFEL